MRYSLLSVLALLALVGTIPTPASAQQGSIKMRITNDGHFRWTCSKCSTDNAATKNPNRCYKCGANGNFSFQCRCGQKIEIGTTECPNTKCNRKFPKVYGANPKPGAGGTTAPAKRFCSHCGTKANADAKFCGKCGKPLPKPTKPVTKPTEPGTGPEPKPEPKPETKDPEEQSEEERAKTERTQKRIKALEAYYATMYAKHLKSRDWFIRARAMAARGKIDCKETTDKLMTVVENDRDPMIRMYAWEALHARAASLAKMPDYHRRWVSAGVKAAYKGGFRGDLRVALIKAVEAYGPKPPGFEVTNDKLITYILKTTSHERPADSRTLTALRKLIATWKDPKITQSICRMLSNATTANKAEYVLGSLNPAITPIGKWYQKTPSADWRKKQGEWSKWVKENLTEETASVKVAKKPYVGKSKYFPPAEKITDPNDPKWRKDLELGKLKFNDVEIAFVIDSTGSMQHVMNTLAKQLVRMIAALNMVSREPRIGTVYYRHEEDPALQVPCCKQATGQQMQGRLPNGKTVILTNYRTLLLPLTSQVEKLAEIMLKQVAGGGHAGGAPHGGMITAIRGLKWTKSKTAKRVLVVIGDTPPTAGTSQAIETLVTTFHKKHNFTFHSMRVLSVPQLMTEKQLKQQGSRHLPNYAKIAKLGGGTSIIGQFLRTQNGRKSGQVAPPHSAGGNFRALVIGIIQGMINEDYRSRVAPVVNVLVEHSQSPVARRR